MNGLYDILESYRLQDPKFTYEGLYQDPRRDDTTYYSGDLKDYPYGLISDVGNYQAFQSSAFPQDYPWSNSGVGSLFDPRVGKSRQSIYFNEPSLNAPQDFYQSIGDPFQTDYPTTRTIQEEDEEDQMIQEITAPYTGVTGMGYQTPRTIADQNRILGQTFTEQKPSGIARLFEILGNLPTPMNILRGGLESLQGFNQRIRNTDFGRSKTLQEYFQRREARKDSERLQTVGQQLQQASDRGGGYQDTSREQNEARTSSRVGPGGQSRAYGL
jgi:hypothetical protein